jgi:hemerythrin superfamily protein
LKDLVEHHATEEREMFPRAKKLMDREELVGGLVAMLTTEVDSDPLTR